MNDPRPAFLLHVRDFWSAEAVELMSAADIGIYLFLLCRQWETGSLPADAAAVRRLCQRIVSADAADLERVLEQFPVDPDGRRRNPRLEFERRLADEAAARQSKRAKTRWDRWRAQKQGSDADAMPRHSHGTAAAMPSEGIENGREGNGRYSVPPGLEPAPRGASPGGLFGEESKKPKTSAKKGDHVAAVEMFQRAWARIRHGNLEVTVKTDPKDIPAAHRYNPTAPDFIAAAALWKRIGGDTQLLRERMSNFFQSDAPYIRAGGFALFASRFDRLDQPIMALNGSAQPEE